MTHAQNLSQKIQAFRDAAEQLNEAWSKANYSEDNFNGQIDDITSRFYYEDIAGTFNDFVVKVGVWADYCTNELNKLP